MKKTLSILILISFLIFTQCAIDGCAEEGTGNDAGKCTTCSSGYLKSKAATSCIKGCKTADESTADSVKCAECTTKDNISTDKLSCIANCQETGTNSGVCKTCADGYTLSTDQKTCTKGTSGNNGGNGGSEGDGDGDGDDDSGFGLHYSLIILALIFLF